MSTHTPGPWNVVNDAREQYAVVVVDTFDEQVAFTGDLLRLWPECEANARLIAAAPEMYLTRLSLWKAAYRAEGLDITPDAYHARVLTFYRWLYITGRLQP